jgi:hypothetical protein
MVRSSTRVHFRNRAEFDRELLRIEVELKAEESGRTLDAVFARCGFYTDEDGSFVDAMAGAKARGR